MTTIEIPTIDDSVEGFELLFVVVKQFEQSQMQVRLDFSKCKFLMQNAVAVLGGLASLAKDRGGSCVFLWDTLPTDVQRSLGRNGFMPFFGQPTVKVAGRTAVPFRQDLASAKKNEIIHYLTNDWIGKGRVNLSEALKNAIVGKTWEIYANAFDHTHSPIGIFSCGQHYPKKKTLKLSVVDFGVGIPFNVRRFTNQPQMSAAQALQWAFRRGNSTKLQDGIARGLGLDLLREFVKLNKGKLEIYSHEGHVCIDETQRFASRKETFSGTIVNITFSCDESFYRLASEATTKLVF